MNLLDTHVAIWWFAGDFRLGNDTKNILCSEDCAFSVVSLWEVQIKHSLGKLPCDAKELKSELAAAGVSILPVFDRHIMKLAEVVTAHNDPFDRLLLATSLCEGMRLISADHQLLFENNVCDARK